MEQIDLKPHINTLSIHQSAKRKQALIPQILLHFLIAGGWKLTLSNAVLSQSCRLKLWALCSPSPVGNRDITIHKCFRDGILQPCQINILTCNWRLMDNVRHHNKAPQSWSIRLQQHRKHFVSHLWKNCWNCYWSWIINEDTCWICTLWRIYDKKKRCSGELFTFCLQRQSFHFSSAHKEDSMLRKCRRTW